MLSEKASVRHSFGVLTGACWSVSLRARLPGADQGSLLDLNYTTYEAPTVQLCDVVLLSWS